MSTIRTSLPSCVARFERPGGDLHRIALGPLLIHRRARLRADLDELLDGRRAVDVAGRHARRSRSAPRAGSAASFAVAVVLPDPCSPAIRITVGGRGEKLRPADGAAHQLGQLLGDDLHDLLAGVQPADDLGAEAALLQLRGELPDDLEVDVRLEQREADLAHRSVDVLLGQGAAAAHLGRAPAGASRRASRTSTVILAASRARPAALATRRQAVRGASRAPAAGPAAVPACRLRTRLNASPMPPNASANSDGTTNTLLASPSASWGSICRYS